MTGAQAISKKLRPILALSMGDPMGVGPEIIVKALEDQLRLGATGLVGNRGFRRFQRAYFRGSNVFPMEGW
jgi:hypothetical protein